jgi:hypothetical protein
VELLVLSGLSLYQLLARLMRMVPILDLMPEKTFEKGSPTAGGPEAVGEGVLRRLAPNVELDILLGFVEMTADPSPSLMQESIETKTASCKNQVRLKLKFWYWFKRVIGQPVLANRTATQNSGKFNGLDRSSIGYDQLRELLWQVSKPCTGSISNKMMIYCSLTEAI